MGVKDLWQLLSPTGRRVSIETLAGKTLAIDASIWITQFIKAMRDDSGNMMKNAHIIGTLRRILKLLYNKIKPVFVFDGEAPVLKIQTLRNRRKIHERHELNLKRQAERILMSRLKKYAIESHRKKINNSSKRGDTTSTSRKSVENESSSYTKGFTPMSSKVEEVNIGDEEEVFDSNCAAIQTSAQIEPVYRPVTTIDEEGEEETEWVEGYTNLKHKTLKSISDDEDEKCDDDEIYDMPELFTDYMTQSPSGGSSVDIDVLAALPPHMRKVMIEQARTKERKRKRENYIPVAADPVLYSQTQIANFLRASKLNKVISNTQELSQKKNDENYEFTGAMVNKIASDGSRRYVMLGSNDNAMKNDYGDRFDDSVPGNIALCQESIRESNNNGENVDLTAILSKKLDSDNFVDEDSIEGGGFCVSDENNEIKYYNSATLEHDSTSQKAKKTCPSSMDWECMSCSFFNTLGLNACEFCGLVTESCPQRRGGENNGEPNVSTSNTVIEEPEEVTDANYLHAGYDDEEEYVDWESASSNSDIEDGDNNEHNSPIEENHHVLEDRAKHGFGIDTDMLRRAVSSASGMGDWAGRAVQRVLQGHVDSSKGEHCTQHRHKLSPLSSDAINDAKVVCSSTDSDANIGNRTQLFSKNSPPSPSPPNEEILCLMSENEMIQHGRSTTSGMSLPLHSEAFNQTPNTAYAVSGLRASDSGSFNIERTSTSVLDDDIKIPSSNDDVTMKRALRDTQRLTGEMVEDVKRMLDLFHLPWVTAPYEAEAQCASLEQMGIVQGVVTEDSDVFLFGGECVYKNMFDERKYVEVYLAEDIKRELGLTRSELVCLSYLLGSDYTEGVRGVGIVNAMEIISAFGITTDSESHSNSNIKGHERSVSETEGGFMNSVSFRSALSGKENESSCDDPVRETNQPADSMLEGISTTMHRFREWLFEGYISNSSTIHEDLSNKNDVEGNLIKLRIFDEKHTNARSRWSVSDNFPELKVAEAYIKPKVDPYDSPFSFSPPELYQIQDYCRDILGWTDDEINSKVLPVIQRWLPFLNGEVNRGDLSQHQQRIDSYYRTYHNNSRFAKIRSNRLRNAVENKKNSIT